MSNKTETVIVKYSPSYGNSCSELFKKLSPKGYLFLPQLDSDGKFHSSKTWSIHIRLYKSLGQSLGNEAFGKLGDDVVYFATVRLFHSDSVINSFDTMWNFKDRKTVESILKLIFKRTVYFIESLNRLEIIPSKPIWSKRILSTYLAVSSLFDDHKEEDIISIDGQSVENYAYKNIINLNPDNRHVVVTKNKKYIYFPDRDLEHPWFVSELS